MRAARHPTALRVAALLDAAGIRTEVVEFDQTTRTSAAARIGEKITRADAEFVRQHTGYAIGGVAPVGLPPEAKVLLDDGLRACAIVWAAAGTPFSVVPLAPAQLPALTGAGWADVAA